jgi:hypothetical protein
MAAGWTRRSRPAGSGCGWLRRSLRRANQAIQVAAAVGALSGVALLVAAVIMVVRSR